jgi:hypothetical protein
MHCEPSPSPRRDLVHATHRLTWTSPRPLALADAEPKGREDGGRDLPEWETSELPAGSYLALYPAAKPDAKKPIPYVVSANLGTAPHEPC